MMPADIDHSAAVAIAKHAASERGYVWIEPTMIVERGADFVVSSNAETLGGNIVVSVD